MIHAEGKSRAAVCSIAYRPVKSYAVGSCAPSVSFILMILYESKAMGVNRYVWVYTPPDYDRTNKKYPVYYLLHGNDETQCGWVMNGRANIILDNLIADGKAVPMIVGMPHGHAVQSASVGPFKAVQQPGTTDLLNFTAFTKDLLDQIISTIESAFQRFWRRGP